MGEWLKGGWLKGGDCGCNSIRRAKASSRSGGGSGIERIDNRKTQHARVQVRATAIKQLLPVSVRVAVTLASWPWQQAAGVARLTALAGGQLSRAEGDHGHRQYHCQQMRLHGQEQPPLCSSAPLAHSMMMTAHPSASL